MVIFYVFLFLGGAFVVFIVGTALYAGITTAPFAATPKKFLRQALASADLRPGDVLCDLGCGDGRVLIAAARDFGARAYGCDLSYFRFLLSKLYILACGLRGKAGVAWRDLYKEDVGSADVVFVWLRPPAHAQLEEKFNRELKPGARVVTYSSPLPFWEPERILWPDPQRGRVFVYVKR